MVAFKEEFPYLRCDSGQLFEFNQQWLRNAITRAADAAGYPSWWLTDHIAESIAFYLRLRNDEPVVPFDQAAAQIYARLPFRRHRFDRLIAAHALALDVTLVTANERDFRDIAALRVENWTK